MKVSHRLFALMMVIMASGCGNNDQAVAKVPDPGRPETKQLKAADAIGYDGDALRGAVDNMLNDNDKKMKELQDAQKPPE